MTKSLRCKGKDQTHYQRLADLCVCVCLCVFYICAYVNAVWFWGSISLPCGAKLREGQPDGYILTSTHPVMSTVCVYLCERIRVCVCVRVWAGRPAKRRHCSAEQRVDRRVGRGALPWPRRPSLRVLMQCLCLCVFVSGLRGAGCYWQWRGRDGK